jgi:hypothetical protein
MKWVELIRIVSVIQSPSTKSTDPPKANAQMSRVPIARIESPPVERASKSGVVIEGARSLTAGASISCVEFLGGPVPSSGSL